MVIFTSNRPLPVKKAWSLLAGGSAPGGPLSELDQLLLSHQILSPLPLATQNLFAACALVAKKDSKIINKKCVK